MEELIKLKQMVEYCLKEFPETRNSDIKLTNTIWWNFYKNYLKFDEENNLMVRLVDIYHLPKEDNVKRLRAKFQNELHLYLPDDPEVRRQRKIKEEQWRLYLNFNSI